MADGPARWLATTEAFADLTRVKAAFSDVFAGIIGGVEAGLDSIWSSLNLDFKGQW